MSSNIAYLRPQVHLSQDEWSRVIGYLFHDAFESACDLANMSMVCRDWRDMLDWNTWSRAFHFFDVGKQFPSALINFMRFARKGGGKVNGYVAMEHLGLEKTNFWGTYDWLPPSPPYIPYVRLGELTLESVYKIEDLLCAATAKYIEFTSMVIRTCGCYVRDGSCVVHGDILK